MVGMPMFGQAARESISVIVPTIGRPASLRDMLASVREQTFGVHEVVVADGSSTEEIAEVVNDCLRRGGLDVKHVRVSPPNAVRQRRVAIESASGDYLLFLDDDVILEPECVEELIRVLRNDQGAVSSFADFNNQSWPMPTRAWRLYLRTVLGMKEGEWQGRVLGPLLRFGFGPTPTQPVDIEWLGTCNSMVRRSAYLQAGGFSDFFLHRCTMNEDVDLGLKIARLGRIVFCPKARMGHFHAPGGRVSAAIAAEDDLYNRYLVMRKTQGLSAARAFGLIVLFFSVETASSLLGALIRLQFQGAVARLWGRVRAMVRIVFGHFGRSAGNV